MSLEAISLPPSNGKSPQNLIILLHGWGANYQDLVPLASMFKLENSQFLFPNAPFAHPQVPGGRAWYDLDSSNYNGLTEAREKLFDWLQLLPESTGVSPSRTIMMGFSQGGAMTLDIGLQLPLLGLVAMSGYLHFQPDAEILAANSTLPPVLMVHGRLDPVVPIQAAQQARSELTTLGVNVDYHEFNMGHEISMEALSQISQFLQDILNKVNS